MGRMVNGDEILNPGKSRWMNNSFAVGDVKHAACNWQNECHVLMTVNTFVGEKWQKWSAK